MPIQHKPGARPRKSGKAKTTPRAKPLARTNANRLLIYHKAADERMVKELEAYIREMEVRIKQATALIDVLRHKDS